MWPWRTVGTLADRVKALEERLYTLEERDMESRLSVLDAAERLATRLQDRVRKRRIAQDDEEPGEDSVNLLALARQQYGGNGR